MLCSGALSQTAFTQTMVCATHLMRVPIYTYRGQHIHIRYSGAQQTSHIENSVTLEAISSLDE